MNQNFITHTHMGRGREKRTNGYGLQGKAHIHTPKNNKFSFFSLPILYVAESLSLSHTPKNNKFRLPLFLRGYIRAWSRCPRYLFFVSLDVSYSIKGKINLVSWQKMAPLRFRIKKLSVQFSAHSIMFSSLKKMINIYHLEKLWNCLRALMRITVMTVIMRARRT